MIAQANTNKNDFNYVWRCNDARAEPGESIPMRPGDYLFICVDGNGSAHFRYRAKDWRENAQPCDVGRENAEFWRNASGSFDAKSGELNGHVDEKRKFTLKVAPKGNGYSIWARHFVNPEEGEWTGEDGWGSPR